MTNTTYDTLINKALDDFLSGFAKKGALESATYA